VTERERKREREVYFAWK